MRFDEQGADSYHQAGDDGGAEGLAAATDNHDGQQHPHRAASLAHHADEGEHLHQEARRERYARKGG